MICIIRIIGRVNLNRDVKETLKRLRLEKKYACVVLANPNKEQMGMIRKMRDFVAFGEISMDVLEKLIEIRGKKLIRKRKLIQKKPLKRLIKEKPMNL